MSVIPILNFPFSFFLPLSLVPGPLDQPLGEFGGGPPDGPQGPGGGGGGFMGPELMNQPRSSPDYMPPGKMKREMMGVCPSTWPESSDLF